jgi:DNA-binding PadR family transcriptional regulator
MSELAPEPPAATEATVDAGVVGGAPDAAVPQTAERSIASSQDGTGVPVHRGWAPVGQHHRWMEPFVLVLLAGGASHGYAVVSELAQLGITNGSVDVGQVYRTLRDLERAGQVRSLWMTGSGPARRDYELTPAGARALDEWAAVMKDEAPDRRVRRRLPRLADRAAANEPALEALCHRVVEAPRQPILVRGGQAPVEHAEVQLLLGQVHLEQRVQAVQRPADGHALDGAPRAVVDVVAVAAELVDQAEHRRVLLAHRRHRVPALHELLEPAVERRFDRRHVRDELADEEGVLLLEQVVERRALDVADHLGEDLEAVDVGQEARVVVLAGRAEGAEPFV